MDNVHRSIAGLLVVAFSAVTTACIHINIPPPPAPLEEHQVSGSGKDKILLVDVSGMISSEDKESFYTYPSMIATIKEELTRASRDESVKALVLRINTPGGTVTASDIIHHELKLFKASRKIPVIASIMDVGASGGYYIACPADRILANPGTVTGSIGVIAEWLNYKELAEWAKLKPVVFKSGELKDTGSPLRDVSETDRKFFQAMIDELCGQFVQAVADGRQGRGPQGNELNYDRVKTLADGRVYTGESALKNGLIDEIGNYEDSVKATAKLAGIKGEPSIVTPPKQREGLNLLELLLSTTKIREISPAELPNQLIKIDTSIKFKFQWQ